MLYREMRQGWVWGLNIVIIDVRALTLTWTDVFAKAAVRDSHLTRTMAFDSEALPERPSTSPCGGSKPDRPV